MAKKGKTIIIAIALVVAACAVFCAIHFIRVDRYNGAQEKMAIRDYEAAMATFTSLGSFKDSSAKVMECKYAIAQTYFEQQQYEYAITAFQAIEEYSDAASRIEDCKYALADVMFSKKQYEEAITYLQEIPDHESGKTLMLQCKYALAKEWMDEKDYSQASTYFAEISGYQDSDTLRMQCDYEQAMQLKKEKKYGDALRLLFSLEDFEDAPKQVVAIEKEQLSQCKKGDVLQFGEYEQDGDSHGKEPIDWIVLTVDDGKALLLSRYILFKEEFGTSTREPLEWTNSRLRSSLSGRFFDTFSDNEKELILTGQALEGEYYDHWDEKDSVFILSSEEIREYLTDAAAKPTKSAGDVSYYWVRKDAKSNSAQIISDWLRSNGRNTGGSFKWLPYYVNEAGEIYYGGEITSTSSGGVRPAMWVHLSKENK